MEPHGLTSVVPSIARLPASSAAADLALLSLRHGKAKGACLAVGGGGETGDLGVAVFKFFPGLTSGVSDGDG